MAANVAKEIGEIKLNVYIYLKFRGGLDNSLNIGSGYF